MCDPRFQFLMVRTSDDAASFAPVLREAVWAIAGMRVVVAGATLGLAAAWHVNQALSSMLFELEPSDPGTYLAVVLLVGTVAGVACYGPARRAARVDPVRSLRQE